MQKGPLRTSGPFHLALRTKHEFVASGPFCAQAHMMRLLSVVEDVFQLSGRGSVVVIPGAPREGKWRLKVGDPLILRLPDGSEVETIVGGLEMGSPPHPEFIPLMLGPGLTKESVPLRTELWVD